MNVFDFLNTINFWQWLGVLSIIGLITGWLPRFTISVWNEILSFCKGKQE